MEGKEKKIQGKSPKGDNGGEGRKLKVENRISMDPHDPIPINYGGNTFRVVLGKKYLPFLAGKDNFPNLLLEARLTSVTQDRCIKNIVRAVIGNGLSIKGVEPDKIDPAFKEWLKCVNNDNETFDSFLSSTLDGERAFGNQFIELVRGSFGKHKFLKVYNKNLLFCRLNEPDDYSNPVAVIQSKLLAKQGYLPIPQNAISIPLYSKNILDQKKCWVTVKNADGEHTMIHFKNKMSGVEYYGLPDSVAGLRYQVLEGKAAQFNLDNLDNNMVLGGMLILKSAMTSEEADAQAKEIMMTHIGEGKTGRIAVISSESGLDDVEYKNFETSKDGSFIESDKMYEKKIIGANGWNAVLISVNDAGKGLTSGGDYIRSIYDMIESMLLNPLRKKLIDEVVKPIIGIWADWTGNNAVLEYEFEFLSSMPFSFMGELDPSTFMQVNEARSLGGLQPDSKMDGVYISEVSKNNKKDVQTKPTA